MPWRKKDACHTRPLSETMLQQTQVEKAKGYYGRFSPGFSFLVRLGQSKGRGSPMGRPRLLFPGEKPSKRQGPSRKTWRKLPEDKESFLPGIGEYTPPPYWAIAFHKREIAVDGNLIRVFKTPEKEGENKDKKDEGEMPLFFLDRLKTQTLPTSTRP